MLIIGLTGGISSGKTTVANYFAELGITVIDADQIAREVTNQPNIIESIVKHFGKTLLDKNHQINRAKLREIIFNDSVERDWLEQLLHPVILQEIQQRTNHAASLYCLLVIPLLLEKAQHIRVDRILVVDVAENLQIQRTQQRDQINANQVDAIIKTQINREERLQHADDVIENNGSLTELKQQVEQLHQLYLKL